MAVKIIPYGSDDKVSVTWPNTGTATTTLNETKVNRIMAALVSLGLIVTT
jgi:hypothetical protein